MKLEGRLWDARALTPGPRKQAAVAVDLIEQSDVSLRTMKKGMKE